MDHATLFAMMGTGLLYFIYKTYTLHKLNERLQNTIVGVALGEVEVTVNRKTKQIRLDWKEENESN
jgi:hypothetical protein